MISPSPVPALAILVTKSPTALMFFCLQFSDFLVHDDFSESGSGPGDSGDQISDRFDALNLLLQEALQEVSQVAVVFASGERVEIDDRLVYGLLQLQGSLHRVQSTSPFVLFRLGDVLQDNAAATSVLLFHELFGMFCFLGGCFLEVLGQSRKSDVVT